MDTSTLPKVKLPNGQEVIDLYNMTGTGLAAIVNMEVMQRIISQLPEANFNEIQRDTMNKIEAAQSLEHMVKIMETEVAFHKTVNIISTIDLSPKAQP